MSESQGEIFDLGYKRYEGPREGRWRARKALWVNGVRSVLGLGRGLLAKVFPAVLLTIALGLALIITITTSFGPDPEIPDAAGYNQILSFFMLLFAAIIAPDLLCPDRRDNVIHLYLVRPMSFADYVGARWLALFVLLASVVYLGQLVLYAGLAFADDKPLDYIRDSWQVVPKFLAAGFLLAVFATTLTMAVSAFTTRRAYAQAFIIGVLFVSIPVAAVLTGCGEETVVQGRYIGMDQEGNWLIAGNVGFVDEQGDFIPQGGPAVSFEGGPVDVRSFGGQQIVVVTDSETQVEPGLAEGDLVRVSQRHDGADPIVADKIGSIPERCEPWTGDAAKWIALVDLPRSPVVISDMVFDKENSSYGYMLVAELPDVVPVLWYILLVVGPGFALWWRYRRITV